MYRVPTLRTSSILVLLFGIFFSIPSIAHGQISVDRVFIDFTAGTTPVRNVVVRNNSERPMFVKVDSIEVRDAGSAEEKREPTSELLVSPKRFSVAANGERTVRLLLRKPLGAVEQIFRVSFVPEAGEFDDDAAVAETAGRRTVLHVLTGVGILIFAQPTIPTPKLVWERSGNQVTLRNEGNVNILIDALKACKRDDPKNCRGFPTHRLYAQNFLSVTTSKDEIVRFTRKIGDDYTDIEVP